LLLFVGTDSTPANIDTLPTIFSRVARLGGSSGIVGNYLPYCRLRFAEQVQRCTSIAPSEGGIPGAGRANLLGKIVRDIESLAPWWSRHSHIERYAATVDSARSMASDTTLNVVFVHFAMPHEPWIFDRQSNDFTLFRLSPRGYFDNLVLSDHALRAVREAMERANVWDRTTVIVLSDHQWRTATRVMGAGGTTIPFIVKLGGGTTPVAHAGLLDAMVLSDLVARMIAGQVSDGPELDRLLEGSWRGGLSPRR
jgi:hypothetical protein